MNGCSRLSVPAETNPSKVTGMLVKVIYRDQYVSLIYTLNTEFKVYNLLIPTLKKFSKESFRHRRTTFCQGFHEYFNEVRELFPNLQRTKEITNDD